MDEPALILRLQQGDESAFEPLYRRYIDQAVRAAFLVTRSQQAAEDAAHETFVQVIRKIHTLRNPHGFRSWFYSILLNAARRSGRKGRGWLFLPLDLLRRNQPDTGAPPPDEVAAQRQEVRELRAGLARLPESHRVPVILRYYVEMTEPEIAEALNLPLGTVKSRLHTARQKLSQMMAHPPLTEGGSEHAR